MNYPNDHPGWQRLAQDVVPKRTIDISNDHPDPEMRRIVNDLFELYADEVIVIE